jgi:hypothetical protein
MFVGNGEDVISPLGLNSFDQFSLRISKVQLDTKGELRMPEGKYCEGDLPSSGLWPGNISMTADCCGYIRDREKYVG